MTTGTSTKDEAPPLEGVALMAIVGVSRGAVSWRGVPRDRRAALASSQALSVSVVQETRAASSHVRFDYWLARCGELDVYIHLAARHVDRGIGRNYACVALGSSAQLWSDDLCAEGFMTMGMAACRQTQVRAHA